MANVTYCCISFVQKRLDLLLKHHLKMAQLVLPALNSFVTVILEVKLTSLVHQLSYISVCFSKIIRLVMVEFFPSAKEGPKRI